MQETFSHLDQEPKLSTPSIIRDSAKMSFYPSGIKRWSKKCHRLCIWLNETITRQEATQTRFSQSGPFTLLPLELWMMVTDHMDPCDKAALAFTSKYFLERLGSRSFEELNMPTLASEVERYKFLIGLDQNFPQHRLCFACATFHYSFNRCFYEHGGVVSIYPGRVLRFDDAQLAARACRYGKEFGILDRALYPYHPRTSADTDWTYTINYAFVEDHLLLRIDSITPVVPDSCQRCFIFEHKFSVCHHYGIEVEDLCWCSMRHVRNGIAPSNHCSKCSRLRRCHSCPSEYQVRIEHDALNPNNEYLMRVIRWTDLGDCKSPYTREWQRVSSHYDDPQDIFFDISGGSSVQSRYEASHNRVDDTSGASHIQTWTPLPVEELLNLGWKRARRMLEWLYSSGRDVWLGGESGEASARVSAVGHRKQ